MRLASLGRPVAGRCRRPASSRSAAPCLPAGRAGLSFRLGIDTGGTYTDAVLLDRERRVARACKALTTHGDLAQGIGEAMAGVLDGAAVGSGLRRPLDHARHQRPGRGPGRARGPDPDRRRARDAGAWRPRGGAARRSGALPCRRSRGEWARAPAARPRGGGRGHPRPVIGGRGAGRGRALRCPQPRPRAGGGSARERDVGASLHRLARAVGAAGRATPGRDDPPQRPAHPRDPAADPGRPAAAGERGRSRHP